MARNISTESLAKLAQTHGAEPVIILEIQWSLDGTYVQYASKNVRAFSTVDGVNVFVPGKIVEMGSMDSVVAISLNETSEEITFALDDKDNALKEIIDVNDIMLRNVRVYQWFEGLNWEDRFLIFQGKINSPISWSETDRTLKFSVVSQLEDKDVGFSPEEGDFPDLPQDMVGKVWPECFGTSVHQKALQVDFKHSGTLGEPVGLADFTIPSRIAALAVISQFLSDLGVLYATAAGFAGLLGLDNAEEQLEDKANSFFEQAGQKNQAIADLQQLYADQLATEVDEFRVIGGEHFPRGTLKLEINEAIFTGNFIGPQGEEGSDIFHVSCADHPERKNFHLNTTPCGNPGCSNGNWTTGGNCKDFPSAEGFSITQNNVTTFIPTGNILGEQAGEFFAQGGTSVTIYSNEPIRYFVSITPGTVRKVAAFTTFDSGERVLVDVPTNLYRVYRQSYGSVAVTVVEVTDALSKQDPPWEDTIYVTYESSVGPNPIDIMKYLISKYSDLPYDVDSFNECREALDPYPMHFCLMSKKNIVTVLKELAFQARMAISIKNGIFFCHYMPAEPDSIHEFSEDNVLTQSVELGFTDTEELVTKYVATWAAHGAQEEDNKTIVKYNVKKYGVHEESVDMYAYNFLAAIVKTLSFWINRRGHTWKKLTFQAPLDALNVETLDGVTLNFDGDYASYDATLGLVEEGRYNPDENTMDFTVWTGVRAGDMTQYDAAYPQDIDISTQFPDPVATAAGFAGSDSPGSSAAGSINRSGSKQGITVRFGEDAQVGQNPFELLDPSPYEQNIKRDTAAGKASDRNDVSPGRPDSNDTGQVVVGTGPPPTPAIDSVPINDSGEVFWIDIRTTPIADSDNPGETATLDTFFSEITGAILKAKTDATWKESGGQEAEFDFKFDMEGNKFGAGTAFLKDD